MRRACGPASASHHGAAAALGAAAAQRRAAVARGLDGLQAGHHLARAGAQVGGALPAGFNHARHAGGHIVQNGRPVAVGHLQRGGRVGGGQAGQAGGQVGVLARREGAAWQPGSGGGAHSSPRCQAGAGVPLGTHTHTFAAYISRCDSSPLRMICTVGMVRQNRLYLRQVQMGTVERSGTGCGGCRAAGARQRILLQAPGAQHVGPKRLPLTCTCPARRCRRRCCTAARGTPPAVQGRRGRAGQGPWASNPRPRAQRGSLPPPTTSHRRQPPAPGTATATHRRHVAKGPRLSGELLVGDVQARDGALGVEHGGGRGGQGAPGARCGRAGRRAECEGGGGGRRIAGGRGRATHLPTHARTHASSAQHPHPFGHPPVAPVSTRSR